MEALLSPVLATTDRLLNELYTAEETTTQQTEKLSPLIAITLETSTSWIGRTAELVPNPMGEYATAKILQRTIRIDIDDDDEDWTPDDVDDVDDVDDIDDGDTPVEPPPPPPSKLDLLSDAYVNLSRLAEEERYAHIEGKEKEVRGVMQALVGGIDRQHSILVGEGQNAKLDVIKQLAHTLTHTEMPGPLGQKQLVMFDVNSLPKYGNASEVYEFIDKCMEIKDEVICVIPHINKLDTYYRREALDYIRTKMGKGLQVVATIDKKKDSVFNEHEKGVTRIFIKEKRREQVLRLLETRYQDSGELLGVSVSEKAMNTAYDLAKRILEDERKDLNLLFDRCALLLDLAIGEIQLRQYENPEEYPTPCDLPSSVVKEVAPLIANGKLSPMGNSPLKVEEPLELASRLKGKVFGQEQAIDLVSDAIIRCAAGLKSPDRPIGNFLFMGPTGVGKTELAKQIAGELFGDEKSMVRIDMSEYQHAHNVSRLIGSPPGYVGYDEGGQLTNAVKETPCTVVLLEEVDKAHPDVLKVFLQVFDDGRLTDGQGDTVDFSNCLFIMTSNFESQTIMDLYRSGKDAQEVADIVEPLLTERLSPELYNRLEAIPFNCISKEVFKLITPFMLNKRADEIRTLRGIDMMWGDDIMEYLFENGYSEEFGVRPLRRVIEKDMISPLARALVGGVVDTGDTAEFYVDEEGKIAIRRYEA